uniref:PDZ domain-containing protein n=1 Tax=Bursaphelenchus xylophilus TaxID=6326 RepID=A0A1I7RU57_BURXY
MAESSTSASQRKLDVITLRMARLDPKVPWGFTVRPPGVVDKVQGAGLADRAGLQSGDHIDEIQGESSPTFIRVTELINEPNNQLDLTVLRDFSDNSLL